MALKIYCDRCGSETTTSYHIILPLKKEIDLCGDCEAQFKVFMVAPPKEQNEL